MKLLKLLGAGTALLLSVGEGRADRFSDTFGPRFRAAQTAPQGSGPKAAVDILHRWNQIAIDATGLDHTPVAAPDPRIFGEQIGPARASRAMAIVHVAMFDAMNAATPTFRSYTGIKAKGGAHSTDAALSQAAHDTLVALYPSQAAAFDAFLAEDLFRIKSKTEKANGVELGQRVAAAILAMRAHDGSEKAEPKVGIGHMTSDEAGHWRQDPLSSIPLALGAYWGECTPFVLAATNQFRTSEPPAMSSAAYAAAFNEVKALGGDGVITTTQRTDEQTFIGLFWAYDGTPSLCAPPRLYNQITVQIADQTRLGPLQLARLLALVNVAMADTAMAVWDSKYFWDFWRPVTGIRESDVGTGPLGAMGAGDGNDATIGNPSFTPLGAPASNLTGPNFTPPFPAYPSGHAGFGGALFQTLRRFYGTDRLGFTFVSDEFNGVTKDRLGNVRPRMARSFSTLSQAEEENGQSRIYLGIHWSFDKTEGIAQGRRVADYVFDNAFLPVHH